MARRIATNRGSFVRGSRRLTDWGVQVATNGQIAVAANSKVLLAAVPAATLDDQAPATIVRTRGYLSVVTDAGGVQETQVGAFGIALFNSVSLNAGIASLPSPDTNATFDGWFVWDSFGQVNLVNTAVGIDAQGATRYVIDSKAMRKFDRDMGLALIAENAHATQAFNVLFNIRFLIKAG